MVIVTGGTGLVGSRLIFDLINMGEEVTAIIRSENSVKKFAQTLTNYTSQPNGYVDKVNWVNGDLLNSESLANIIVPNCKVYHCAAMVSFNPKWRKKIIEVNVTGTANLVNVCIEKKVEKFCHVSSIGALGGKIGNQLIDEDTPWSAAGKSAYSLSKYYSELEVWRGMAEGLNGVIVNPGVILGAGDWSQGSPSLFHMVANGLKYFTKGTTSYVDVTDVSRAMIELMNSTISGERFLLAAETLSYQKLFSLIADSINVAPPKKYASSNLTFIASMLDGLRSKMFNVEPKITAQTHRIAHTNDNYNGNKIVHQLNFSYTPISQTIKFIGFCYLTKK